MPGKLSKRDEKKWKKSKRIVSKQRGRKPSSFTDRDWGLTQFLFKGQKKASIISVANALDAIGKSELADSFDYILENI